MPTVVGGERWNSPLSHLLTPRCWHQRYNRSRADCACGQDPNARVGDGGADEEKTSATQQAKLCPQLIVC